jgi:hypothetical protein
MVHRVVHAAESAEQVVNLLWRFNVQELDGPMNRPRAVTLRMILAAARMPMILSTNVRSIAKKEVLQKLRWALVSTDRDANFVQGLRERAFVDNLSGFVDDRDRESLEICQELHHSYGTGLLRDRFTRHDNDHSCIQDIQITPTRPELMSTSLPCLPLEADSLDTMTAHVSRHFRLLREDIVSSTREYVTHTRRQERRFLNVEVRIFEAGETAKVNLERSGFLVKFDYPQAPHRLPKDPTPQQMLNHAREARSLLPIGAQILVLQRGLTSELSLLAIGQIQSRSPDKILQKRGVGNKTTFFGEIFVGFAPSCLHDLLSRAKGKRFEMICTKIMGFSHYPILRVLQHAADLPFADQILAKKLPETSHHHALSGLPLPDMFGFVRPQAGISPLNQQLRGKLNESQRAAFDNALTENITLIPGPPGTGKTTTTTHIAVALSQIPDAWPILILTYTNHALDQLLLRIQDVARQADLKEAIRMTRMGGRFRDQRIEQFLFQRDDKKEFSPETKKLWFLQKQQKEAAEKHLNNLVIRTFHGDETGATDLSYAAEAASTITREMSDIRQRENAATIVEGGTRIIGCTTTFSSSNGALIAGIRPRTILVEEAGEILEAHVLSSLALAGSSCTRLIMVGDHKQLRPKIENYNLSVSSGKGYNLNLSLFERWIKNAGFPVRSLKIQQRMFQSLSSIVRQIAYPDLRDGEAISQAVPQSLPGFGDQLAFFNHGHPEDRADAALEEDGTSKSNAFEATMIAGIVKHLLRQPGVKGSSIVVLSAYLEQVSLLRRELISAGVKVGMTETTAKEMSKKRVADGSESDQDSDGGDDDVAKLHVDEIDKVRVSTIDNFQGEEADFIIASLVRSVRPGHLSEVERVTVLMSRAKQGMILLGNKDCLVSPGKRGDHWKTIFRMITPLPYVAIRCSQHGTCSKISTAAELAAAAPNGGCKLKCGGPLECGHVCMRACHFDDLGHKLGSRKCDVEVEVSCAKGHSFRTPCHAKAASAKDSKKCDLCVQIQRMQHEEEMQAKTRQRRAEERRRRMALAEAKLDKDRRQVEAQILEQEEANRHELELARKLIEERKLQDIAQLIKQSGAAEVQEEVRRIKVDAQAELEATQARMAAEVERFKAKKQRLQRDLENELRAMRAKHHGERERLNQETAECKRQGDERLQAEIRKIEDEHRDTTERLAELGQQYAEAHKKAVQEAQIKATLEIRTLQLHLETLKTREVEDTLSSEVECGFCFEEMERREAKTCPHGHIYCADCLLNHVRTECQRPIGVRAKWPDAIVLPCAQCPKDQNLGWTEAANLCLFLEGKDANALIRAVSDVAVERARLAEEIRRQEMAKMNKIAAEEQRLIEEVLNLHCPRQTCKAVYIDFDGCCALTCGRCKCGFCAWCLKDCGADAHAHVAGCKENQMGNRSVHAPKEVVDRHHTQRRERLLGAEIAKLKWLPDEVAELRERMQRFL